MKRIETPRPWPEATSPTPEQFGRWYEMCTAAERLEIITRLLRDSDAAAQCFIQNHKALLLEVEHLRGSYHRGWADALDTVKSRIATGNAEETQ